MTNVNVTAAHGGHPGQPYENCACKGKRCKAYSVVIELELQRVTCPGVWLCNNGKVTMQIFLLGLCTQSSTINPTFPLICHEKFIFRKNFANIQNLVDIDRKLDKEIIYMELIQWEDCSNGNVLATFKTTLNDLLYPFPCDKGVVAGVDVDLLMEATRIFPGIIAPKIEVSTKLTIEEVLCSLKQEKQSDVLVINPKLISSKCVPRRTVPMHQKRVCHNNKYHNLKSSPSPERPCSRKRSVKPLRCSISNQKICSCTEDKTLKPVNIRTSPSCSPSKASRCRCHADNNNIGCNLCKKYKNYFANDTTDELIHQEKTFEDEDATVTQYKLCKCDTVPTPQPSNSWKEPVKEKVCKCKGTDKPSSRKGSKKEMNLCACDGDVKPVCNCKACKGCSFCEEKKSTPKPQSKTQLKHQPKSKPNNEMNLPRTPTPKPQSKTQLKHQPNPKSKPNNELAYTPKSQPKPELKFQLEPTSKPDIEFNLPRASSTPLPIRGNSTCDPSCNQTFYRNLENFYKQLYLRAHHKLKSEHCRCEGEAH